MDFKDAAKNFRQSVKTNLEPKFQRLRDLDLFVLDNSIRESTVGALRGHTLQNKHDIYKQVRMYLSIYSIYFEPRKRLFNYGLPFLLAKPVKRPSEIKKPKPRGEIKLETSANATDSW